MGSPRSIVLIALAVGFAAAACGGNAQGAGSGSGGKGCTHEGVDRAVGERFPAGDGCNTCTCERGGEVSCTEADCDSTCDFGGATYTPGQEFPAGDDCNTCVCEADGTVSCTRLACPPTCEFEGTTYTVGESFPSPDGCNTCSCDGDGNIGCTNRACAPPTTEACLHRGVFHAVGTEFPDGDGCNSCQCTSRGVVGCTKIACDSTCDVNGVSYGDGSTWRADCNECMCTIQPSGTPSVGCTTAACFCDPGREWWRDYIGNSPDECALIDFACPEHTIGFDNRCGCGCEQREWCPQVFSCGPEALCDPEQAEAQCPYSDIARL